MDFSQIAAMAASLAQAAPAAMEAEVVATIKNRFGTFDFTDEQSITLKPGLIGFSEYQQFGLAAMPSGKFSHDFRLLQSLDEANLMFIVYPTTAETALLDTVDVQMLCREYGIRSEDLVLLHVATIREMPQGSAEMTLNVKAPIVVNAHRQTGTQHVLASNKYSTQHALLNQAAA